MRHSVAVQLKTENWELKTKEQPTKIDEFGHDFAFFLVAGKKNTHTHIILAVWLVPILDYECSGMNGKQIEREWETGNPESQLDRIYTEELKILTPIHIWNLWNCVHFDAWFLCSVVNLSLCTGDYLVPDEFGCNGAFIRSNYNKRLQLILLYDTIPLAMRKHHNKFSWGLTLSVEFRFWIHFSNRKQEEKFQWGGAVYCLVFVFNR